MSIGYPVRLPRPAYLARDPSGTRYIPSRISSACVLALGLDLPRPTDPPLWRRTGSGIGDEIKLPGIDPALERTKVLADHDAQGAREPAPRRESANRRAGIESSSYARLATLRGPFWAPSTTNRGAR